MTRINLIDPELLTDQHLFSEFREIKMVPKALSRSLVARGLSGVIDIIPERFTLNKGHVTFFYDKGLYLEQRYELLKAELRLRGISFNELSPFDPDRVYAENPSLYNDYCPTGEAIEIITNRLMQKISMRPDWYRYTR